MALKDIFAGYRILVILVWQCTPVISVFGGKDRRIMNLRLTELHRPIITTTKDIKQL